MLNENMPNAPYHDYSNVQDEDLEKVVNQPLSKGSKKTRRGPRGGVATPFPVKLHQLLEEDAYPDIISWQPHGRSFILRDPQAFLAKVMNKYFKQTKLTSFQRQLNLYAFKRISTGPDKGSYYHELFLRGKVSLCSLMIRMRVKGTKIKSSSCPDNEPNFYRMPRLTAASSTCESNSISEDDGTVESHSLPPLVKSADFRQAPSIQRALVSDHECDSSAASDTASIELFSSFPQTPLVPPQSGRLAYSSRAHRGPQFISPPMELLREPVIPDLNVSEPTSVSFEGKAFYYLDSLDYWDACTFPSLEESHESSGNDKPAPLVGLSVVSGELCGFEHC